MHKKLFIITGITIIIIIFVIIINKPKPNLTIQPNNFPTSEPIQINKKDNPNIKEFNITAKQWSFQPSVITVNQGDTVKLKIKNLDVEHGFAIPEMGINQILPSNQTTIVEFTATKTGNFTFICSIPCGVGHNNMIGTLIVNSSN